MKIVVTGTIGSGKSTLCHKLKAALPSFSFASVDDLVRGMYDNEEFKEYLMRTFSTFDRREVSNIVFDDPRKLKELEVETKERLSQLLASSLAADNVVLEFPLLFEKSSIAMDADLVIAVGCPDAVAVERVKARDSITVEKFNAIRTHQFSNQLRAALADVYIDTSLPALVQDSDFKELLLVIDRKFLHERGARFFGGSWVHIREAITHGLTQEESDRNIDLIRVALRGIQTTNRNKYQNAVELAIWFTDFTTKSSDSVGLAKRVRRMVSTIASEKPEWMVPGSEWHTLVFLAVEMLLSTKDQDISAPMVLANDQMTEATNLFRNTFLTTRSSAHIIAELK